MKSMFPIYLILILLILKVIFHVLTQKSFLTNRWNFMKRDSIEYFNMIFKSLFLCFQEVGNGTNDARIPCKVTLPKYKYFQKIMDPNTPSYRGLYLGHHVSCQAVLEDNSYTHLVSLTTL